MISDFRVTFQGHWDIGKFLEMFEKGGSWCDLVTSICFHFEKNASSIFLAVI